MKVDIPPEFIELCGLWHGGQDTILYAISSCGYLGTGSIRPVDCNTDEEWMKRLLNSLESEIRWCIRAITNRRYEVGTQDEDLPKFEEFLLHVQRLSV